MPYTDSKYPDFLKGLPKEVIHVWVMIWNETYQAAKDKGRSDKFAESRAAIAANGDLKKTWDRNEDGTWDAIEEDKTIQEADAIGSYEYLVRDLASSWNEAKEGFGMASTYAKWTFPETIVVADNAINPGENEKFWQVEWFVDDNGDTQFGAITPIDVTTTVVPVREASLLSEGNLQEVILLEADGPYDKKRHLLPVTVIRPGFTTSKDRYYQKATLAEAVKDGVFNNVKMFTDHGTEGETPVRSVTKWVSTLKETNLGPGGEIKGMVNIIRKEWRTFIEELDEAGELGQLGLSINAFGDGQTTMIEGYKTLSVDKIIKARSVDWVTYPGAGGGVDALLESEAATKQSKVGEGAEPEMEDKNVEENKALLEEELTTLKAENVALKEEIAGMQKETNALMLEAELAKSTLPDPGKERIRKIAAAWAPGEFKVKVEEALLEELNYTTQLLESAGVDKNPGKPSTGVTGMGVRGQNTGPGDYESRFNQAVGIPGGK